MKKSLLAFLIAAAPFCLFAQIPSYLPTDGLVGWWPFNGNANDESGNGNDGTPQSGASLTSDRLGNVNSAYIFDGENDYIILNSIPILNTYSISIWFLADSNMVFSEQLNPNSGATLISQGGSNNPCNFTDFAIGIKGPPYFAQSNQCPQAYFEFERGLNCNFTYYNTCGFVFNQNNNWQNITYAVQDDKMYRYINGNFVDSIQNVLNLSNSGFPLSIGCRYVANNPSVGYGWWKGKIDDIAIYNRALTFEEITALYSGVPTNNNGGGNTATTTVPAGISYQAVARNAQGQPLSETDVQVKFTLLTDSLTGAAEYSESHSLTTNSLGLFTIAFGAGTPETGTFANINWASGSKYLKVELDAGSGFLEMGTQQLLTVPYSMRSNSSAKAGTIENAGLPVYADNAVALAGGLVAGQMYRTPGGVLMIVY